jgi:hypothetical protein
MSVYIYIYTHTHISDLKYIITRRKQCFEASSIFCQSQRFLKAFYLNNSISKRFPIHVFNIASDTCKILQLIWTRPMWYKYLPWKQTLVTLYLFVVYLTMLGASSSVLFWGTVLQARRLWLWLPIRSMDFPIDLILLTTLWPWGWLSL